MRLKHRECCSVAISASQTSSFDSRNLRARQLIGALPTSKASEAAATGTSWRANRWLPRVSRAVHAIAAARCRGGCRSRRLRSRDVLRSPCPVERASGSFRARLVVARRGNAGIDGAIRCRDCAGPALPPGDRRPGDRHARRPLSRPLLGSTRLWRGAQRARHRRPMAGETAARCPSPRVCRRHPRPATRRGGVSRWPRPRRPGQAVEPSDKAPSVVRRSGQRADCSTSRRLGRRPDHGEPTDRGLAPGHRRLS